MCQTVCFCDLPFYFLDTLHETLPYSYAEAQFIHFHDYLPLYENTSLLSLLMNSQGYFTLIFCYYNKAAFNSLLGFLLYIHRSFSNIHLGIELLRCTVDMSSTLINVKVIFPPKPYGAPIAPPHPPQHFHSFFFHICQFHESE